MGRNTLFPERITVTEITYPVFPCSVRTKAPLNHGGHTRATYDPRIIAAWQGENPEMLWGMPTGEPSGIVAVDIDPRHGGLDWQREHEELLAGTYAYRTRSGGTHFLFRDVPGLRCSAGLLAPGVDVRATGGYVVRWDRHGGDVLCDAPPKAMPSAILAALMREQIAAEPREGGTGLDSRLPPSAAAVVSLLDRMPNPIEAGRDDYVRVMLAARGCAVALERAGADDDGLAADLIADAAVAWAERWAGWDGADERAKWENDFGTQAGDMAGWRTLERVATRLLPGYADERARALREAVAAEFGAIDDAGDLGAAGAGDEATSTQAPAGRRVSKLQSVEDIESRPDPEWIIADVLPAGCLAFLFGPPKQGKTFVALSLSLALAHGSPWYGHPTRQGAVVYIAGEGVGGLKLRLMAARAEYGIPADVPLWIWPEALPLAQGDAVRDFVEDVATRAGPRAALVVVDTLARSSAGLDENAAQDMGRIIDVCGKLQARLGCTVLLVHHQGKDRARGMRGSTALDGAADVAIGVERTQEKGGVDYVTVSNLYQKEAQEFAPKFFDLARVPAGGRSSLVLRERTEPPEAAARVTGAQASALAVIHDLMAQTNGAPVSTEDAVAACAEHPGVTTCERAGDRAKAARKVLAKLADNGHVRIDGPEITLAGAGTGAGDNQGDFPAGKSGQGDFDAILR